MQYLSIPVQIPLTEAFRLFCYLKLKHGAFIHKSDIDRLCRAYGKDPRTLQKLISELLSGGFLGHNERTYFIRNFRFVTGKLGIGTRAFQCSLNDIMSREVFEAKVLAATVDYLTSYYRRKARKGKSMKKGRCATYQITPPLSSGLLSKTLSVSTGKVTKLKRFSVSQGFITVKKTFTPIAAGSAHAASLLNDEMPGVFSKDGLLVRRSIDAFESFVSTYRIKNRRPITWRKMTRPQWIEAIKTIKYGFERAKK